LILVVLQVGIFGAVNSTHRPSKILAICLMVHAAASEARVHAQADPIVQVSFTNLMASQFNVGYQAVNDFTVSPFELLYTTGWYNGDTNNPNNWYGPGPEGLWAYQQARPAPVIWGPFINGGDPVYHLLDNHHRTTAFYRLSTIYTNSQMVTVTNPLGQVSTTNIGPAPASVFVQQTLNWSTTPSNQFWADMQAGNTGGVTNFAPVGEGFAQSINQPTFVWNYKLGQEIDLNMTNPPYIPGLTDDTLRAIAGTISLPQANEFGIAEAGYLERGAVGEVLYYQEFYWANYLRPLVYWDTTGTTNVTFGMDPTAANVFTNYDELTLFAANLARDPAADDLPGYLGPVPEPSTTVLLVLGLAAIVAFARRTKSMR
jgi:hypothetical protein